MRARSVSDEVPAPAVVLGCCGTRRWVGLCFCLPVPTDGKHGEPKRGGQAARNLINVHHDNCGMQMCTTCFVEVCHHEHEYLLIVLHRG